MMRSRSSRGRVRRGLGLVVEAMMVLVISNRGGESGEMCMYMALK